MNEAQTRLNKIAPKLRDAGWSRSVAGLFPCAVSILDTFEYTKRTLLCTKRTVCVKIRHNDPSTKRHKHKYGRY